MIGKRSILLFHRIFLPIRSAQLIGKSSSVLIAKFI